MKIKKAHYGAKAFDLQRFSFVIQNMRAKFKICLSYKNMFLKVIVLIVIFLLCSTNAYAASNASIDRAGNRIYFFIVSIGKWVIIVKGAIDVIQAVINGDFQSAKKLFIGYIFAYAILFALPWMFDEIEVIFTEM